MKCYVTELESHDVLGAYPIPPMTIFANRLLTDEQKTLLNTRPVHDVREEIIVTDEKALLDLRLEFDPAPSAPAPPPGDETQ